MKIRKNMRILKKMATVALTAALALSPFATVADSGDFVYAAEEETPKEYTAIYDIAGLYAIRNNLAGNYILMNDIDMTKDTSEGGDYNCGTGWDSVAQIRLKNFVGHLMEMGIGLSGCKFLGSLQMIMLIWVSLRNFLAQL